MCERNGFGETWAEGRIAVKSLFDQLNVSWERVLDDFIVLKGSGPEEVDALLGEWAEDGRARDLFDGFLRQADRGHAAAVVYLKKRHVELQSDFEQQVQLSPHLVGGIDGFLEIYLAVPPKRCMRSSRYRRGVKTGRVLGILCAITIFLPVRLGQAVIRLLPGANRFVTYFLKRWEDAKQGSLETSADVASRKDVPPARLNRAAVLH